MTTGLIEGWQKFEDSWRKDSPILPAKRWAEILKCKGFIEVEMQPQAGSVAEVLGQHVIVAQASFGVSSADAIETVSTVAAPPAEVKVSDTGFDTWQTAVHKVVDSPADQHHANMLDFVQQQVAQVLRMGPEQRPGRRSRLMDIGVDSLLAIELRNRLDQALNLPQRLPASLVFDYPTPEAIATFLEKELVDTGVWRRNDDSPPESTAEVSDSHAEAIEELSDEQVEQMIIERLNRKQKEVDR